MDFLDKMVLYCCGDCHNGHGTSFIDYNLNGSHNSARKSKKQDMINAIDHYTDLSFPIHGYSDQRMYLGSYKYVPVVDSPGAAFIVRYDDLTAPITNTLVTSWPLAVLVFTFISLSGCLFWMLVSVKVNVF